MKTGRAILAFVAGASFALSVPGAAQAADLVAGKRAYIQCVACHSLVEGQAKVGPDLFKIFGAKAATRGKFAYSAALKDSKIVWTEATMDAWLKRPTALVPGTKMVFVGVPNDQRRADLVAYLVQATR